MASLLIEDPEITKETKPVGKNDKGTSEVDVLDVVRKNLAGELVSEFKLDGRVYIQRVKFKQYGFDLILHKMRDQSEWETARPRIEEVVKKHFPGIMIEN